MDDGVKKQQQKEITILRCYQKTFGTEWGKRVLADICLNSHVLDSPFVTGEKSLYRDGERSAAVRILGLLKYDIHKLTALLEEEEKKNE